MAWVHTMLWEKPLRRKAHHSPTEGRLGKVRFIHSFRYELYILLCSLIRYLTFTHLRFIISRGVSLKKKSTEAAWHAVKCLNHNIRRFSLQHNFTLINAELNDKNNWQRNKQFLTLYTAWFNNPEEHWYSHHSENLNSYKLY
jgi:hypothetical protein